MLWDKEEDDVKGIVGQMIQSRQGTAYRPGPEGFLQKDLTQPAGGPPRESPAIDLSTPAGPQRRLEQFGATQPQTGTGVLPVQGATEPYPPLSDTRIGSGGPAVPKYQIPDDMRAYFDQAISTITSPSDDTKYLKNMSQGFGLIGMSPKEAAKARMGATQALAQIEGIKRNAATNLASTLSGLMTDPSKFNLDIFGKQLQYDLGRRGQDIASRRTAVDEMKAPWEIQKMRGQAPDTAKGRGPAGEDILFGWDPEKQTWGEMSRGGVLPVGVPEGGKLVHPTTGKVIAEGGEKRRFQENLGQVAFRGYENAMKAIDEDSLYKTKPELKEEAQKAAWKRLQDTMKRLGYGDMFDDEGVAKSAVPQRKSGETIEQYLERIGP